MFREAPGFPGGSEGPPCYGVALWGFQVSLNSFQVGLGVCLSLAHFVLLQPVPVQRGLAWFGLSRFQELFEFLLKSADRCIDH